MILLSAAIEGQRAERRKVAGFGVCDRLVEVETANGQFQTVEAHCIAQFVRNLLLLCFGAGVEAEEGQRIDVAQRRGGIFAVAEDVGQRTRANFQLSGQAAGPDFVRIETFFVDRHVERVTRKQAAVLARRSIAIALEIVDFAGHCQVAETAFQCAAENLCFRCTVVGVVEQVGEVTFILVVIRAQFEQQRIFDNRAGDYTADGVVRAAAAAVGERTVNSCTEFALEFFGRVAGVQQNRAAGYVAAKQHALRTAQDFHAVEVEQIEHDAAVEAEVYAIDEHADGRIDRRD